MAGVRSGVVESAAVSLFALDELSVLDRVVRVVRQGEVGRVSVAEAGYVVRVGMTGLGEARGSAVGGDRV